MSTRTMESMNSSNAGSREKHLEDLRLKVADAGERLRVTANHAGEEVVAVRASIQESLQVVKDSIVAAETAMIGRTRQAAKVAGQYVRDNVWNWH